MVIKVIGSAEDKPISIKIKDLQYVDGLIGDYELLTSKPQINGHELDGNLSFNDLGLGTYVNELTKDQTRLINKPQINGHTLTGNQSFNDLGLGTYVNELTKDYTRLINKPQINGHTLNGNQSFDDLGFGTKYIEKPTSPAVDSFLAWNGSAWVARTIPNASGVGF